MSDTERVGEPQGRVFRAKLAQLREAERERDDLLRVRKEWESEHGRLSRQLAGAVDALREYGGHREDCNALSGAPDCSCGFDEAMLRALGRGGR